MRSTGSFSCIIFVQSAVGEFFLARHLHFTQLLRFHKQTKQSRHEKILREIYLYLHQVKKITLVGTKFIKTTISLNLSWTIFPTSNPSD